MLDTCKTALLLTDNERLAKSYEEVAFRCNVLLKWEKDWTKQYRISSDVVICTAEYVDMIAEEYRHKAVLVFGKGERIAKWRWTFDRYVFNPDDENELVYSLLRIKPSKKEVKASSPNLTSVLRDCGETRFVKGDYMFDFVQDIFIYKGVKIYLSKGNKLMLARWLFLSYKDNNARTQVCILRKKFGKDFLSDINAKGELKNESGQRD